MSSAHRRTVSTWSGPVDVSSRPLEFWSGAAWRPLGGSGQLLRLERRHGRMMLRDASASPAGSALVTVSRQGSNRQVASSSLLEARFGPVLSAPVPLLLSCGMRESTVSALLSASARCGRADVAVRVVSALPHLIGGGANRWGREVASALLSDPDDLLDLVRLAGHAGPVGGAVPSSLGSALRLLSFVHRAERDLLAAGSSARPSPAPAQGPPLGPEAVSGWRLVLMPDGPLPPLMRALAPLGSVHPDGPGGSVELDVPALPLLPLLSVRALRASAGLVSAPPESVLRLGSSPLGLRFVFPLEVGPVDPQVAPLLEVPSALGRVADVAAELRRLAEDRRVDPSLLVDHLAALDLDVASLGLSGVARLVDAASFGLEPGSSEASALLVPLPV